MSGHQEEVFITEASLQAAGGHKQKGEKAPAVSMQHVFFSYDGTDNHLHDISINIQRGQWVSIAGGNGSGKSTLSRLFNGLLLPYNGSVEIGGIPLLPENLAEVRSRVGMVFQNPDNQFVGSTVEEDIAFGLEGMCLPRKEMQRRISEYAERLAVSELLKRHPSELSGGQKQRVALASVLAMEPEILVLDEASSMLDEEARADLTGILRKMHGEGRYTIISITHDAEEMLASERVLVISEGKVLADVIPEELFRNEQLLSLSRLEAPFMLRMARELERLGLTAEPVTGGKELTDYLWSFT